MKYLVAVVTGASQGVGAAIAVRLARMDFHVCLLARDRNALQGVKGRLVGTGGSAFAYPCDVSVPEQVERVAAEVLGVHGRCDVLVNNAGIGNTNTPVQELSLADWDAMMNTNLRGPFLMLRAFAPAMIARGSGHVINIG